MALNKTITVNIVDTLRGCAAIGLKVRIYRLSKDGWKFLSEELTDAFGRCDNLVKTRDYVAGCYKLVFYLREYFMYYKVECCLPYIEISFDVISPKENFHVPLYITPYGYTTNKL